MKHGIPHKQKVSLAQRWELFSTFLDSPEQALLLVILWKDVETQGGGTFLALILLMSLQNPFGTPRRTRSQ